MAHDIFISHAHADKTIADMVCATLERDGLRCWIAPRDIRPGADWGGAIVDAIRASRVMVLVFSDAANASHHIPREIERAIGRQIPIVPVRIEDVEPRGSLEYSLSSVHWLDAITPPVEAHILRLAATLRSILGLPLEPLAPPAQAAPVVGEPEPVAARTAAPAVTEPELVAARTDEQPLVPPAALARPLIRPGMLIGGLAALLVAVAAVSGHWGGSGTPATPEGGSYLVLRVNTTDEVRVAEVREVIVRRLIGLGVSDPWVGAQGQIAGQLRVILPPDVDLERAKGVISDAAALEMKLIQGGPALDSASLLSSSGGRVPDGMEVVQGVAPEPGKSRVYYLVTRAAAITSGDIRGANSTVDENNLPAVSITLNSDAVAKFASLTGDNVGRQLGIIFGGLVQSAPRIESRMSQAEIRITGTFTQQETADLALILRSGTLPASVTFLEQGRQGSGR